MDLSPWLVAALIASLSKRPSPDPLAILILGPTGSGKTSLSLALAELFRGEVVSCDSVAVYRGMDIGSAKPSPEEQRQLPHHLIDVADPDQLFTAGEYSRQARIALNAIARRHHTPIVTGGTGLYLRALTQGLFAGPVRQEDLRARLQRSHTRHKDGWLHRILTRLDPSSAARIHPNDIPKLIRALEVCLTAKQPLSQAFATGEHPGRDPLTGFRLLRIGLNPPRPHLYERLNHRADAMFHNGLIEETENLLARYGPVQPLDALGYRQAQAALSGTLSLKEAIAQAQQGHRNYAKRQLTWFRKEPDVHWIEDFGNSAETIATVTVMVRKAL